MTVESDIGYRDRMSSMERADSLWDYTLFEMGLKIATGEQSTDIGLVGELDELGFASQTASPVINTVHILQELGSPSNYEGFANVIEDDGRDCLLIARD
jgi:hypothetical protein